MKSGNFNVKSFKGKIFKSDFLNIVKNFLKESEYRSNDMTLKHSEQTVGKESMNTGKQKKWLNFSPFKLHLSNSKVTNKSSYSSLKDKNNLR